MHWHLLKIFSSHNVDVKIFPRDPNYEKFLGVPL